MQKKYLKIAFSALLGILCFNEIVYIVSISTKYKDMSMGSLSASFSPPTENSISKSTDDTISDNTVTIEQPLKCTRNQLLTMRSHMHPKDCIITLREPWRQTCSLTLRTKCPDPANWLYEYYSELQKEYVIEQEKGTSITLDPFVGMSVGCNKGFDALNMLRMGKFDDSLSKSNWKNAMEEGGTLYQSVCNQDSTSAFEIADELKSKQQEGQEKFKQRKGEVHCFEPMPKTYQKLYDSVLSLGYHEKGFKVIHSAVSKEEGKAYFEAKQPIGIENKGLNQQCRDDGEGNCETVDIITLEKYVKGHVDGNGPIHYLQIDVEGYDGDVILGAGDSVLKRVEYLEFEYNWMGSWANQHLYDMVEMLDEKMFTCYWAGIQHLWRITGCWMQYFDVHSWSNVACVNRLRVPRLANKMEAVFQKTLSEDMDGAFKEENEDESLHEILSTDEAQMTLKYLSK